MCLIHIMRWSFVLDAHEKEIGGTEINGRFLQEQPFFFVIGR